MNGQKISKMNDDANKIVKNTRVKNLPRIKARTNKKMRRKSKRKQIV